MATTFEGGRVQLDTLADVAGYIVGTAAGAIATLGIEGHDVETVLSRLTEPRFADTVTGLYARAVDEGKDKVATIGAIGGALVRSYRRHYGI
ncbi:MULTISPECIES: hypothetical protein [unclassified Streptomyces]|uniref:hypothetical protein n=1 Tax=unclassified Streptomyces TaxID=2593676 RepID=UPI0023672B0E|nr:MULTISPECIES: hypothetical protein [unclassified Streptomyces]MDF3141506.1 hypothetical protein [Streptomyces sp. T21Q-yed]WDF45013.1 hypothetical protein PBV52_50840 [Streptomyces sp. T12]